MGVRLTMVWRWIGDLLITISGPPASWSDAERLTGTLVALDWAEESTLATPLTVGEGEHAIDRACRLRRQLLKGASSAW